MSWFTEFKQSLKLPEVEELLDLYFYRPLGYLLVKIIYRTSITPNQLTLASILVSIVAACFYAAGSPVWGALIFILHLVIDCSDGQLARLKKNGTRTGRIIDGAGDYLSTIAVFAGLGIGYADHRYGQSLWWLLVVVTLLSNGVQSSLVDYYVNRFLDYVLDRKSTFEDELSSFREEYHAIKDQKNRGFDKFIIRAYFRYSEIQSKLTGKKEGERLFEATAQDYYKKNKRIMRLWLFIGPTTQVSTLVICSLVNRFDIFFWLMIVGFNAMAVVLWPIQRSIDKTFKSRS